MVEFNDDKNPKKDAGYKPKTSEEIFDEIYKNKENLAPTIKPGIATNIDITKATETLGAENRPELGTQFLQERMQQAESQKIYDEAKKKADDQGFFGEIAGFAAQVAAGAVGGTLEGLGALFDPNMIETMQADEQSLGRTLSDWGTKIRSLGSEYGVQVNPEAQAEGFAPWSREWWLSGAADTVGSVAGFLIPVGAEAKALSVAGEALQGLKTLGTAGKFGNTARKGFNIVDRLIATAPELTETEAWITDGIHKAIVSRHMESTMEAKQVFDVEYKKFIDSGLDETEARNKAAEAASFTYKGNWAMLISDIPQYLLMLRGPKLSKVIDDVELAKKAGTSLGAARLEGIKKAFFNMSTESGEEGYQFILSEEAKHYADVKAGLVEDNEFGDRMVGYAKNAELWSSAVFGALGGGVFQAAGPKVLGGINKYLLKNASEGISENAARIAELTTRKETILKNVSTRQEAVQSGDEDAITVANKQMAFDIGINAAKVGNLDLALDGLEQLKNMTPEERSQYGVDDDFIKNIEQTKKDVQTAAEMWQDNYRRYGSSTAESISIREFHLNHLNTNLPDVKQKVDELVNRLPRIGEVTIHGRKAMEAKLDIKAAERTLSILNWKLKNQKLTEKQKEVLSQQIDNMKSNVESANAAFNDTLTEFKKQMNDADHLVLKSIDGKAGEDLTKAKSTQNLYNNQISQLTDELNYLTSKEGQKEVKETIQKQVDKIKTTQKKARANAQAEEDERLAAGEESGPDMNLSELDQKIKLGEFSESMLDDNLKKALDEYRKGLTPDRNLQPEDNTVKLGVNDTDYNTFIDTGVVSDGILKSISDKVKNKQPLDEREQAIFNSKTADINNLIARDFKKDVEVTSKAINTDGIFATPANAKSVEDMWFGDDKSLNIGLKTPNALAWFSYYNTQAKEKDKTKANKALADFLEGPYDKKVELRFEIDFNYLDTYKDKTFPEIKAAIANKKIPANVSLVPIKAILEKDGKPVIHEGEELVMHLHRGDYENFDDSLKESAKAQITEQKTQILNALYNGKNLYSRITSVSNGHISVAYTEERQMAKNPIKEIGDPAKLEFIYGSNDFYLNTKGEPILDLPTGNVTNGAIYVKTKTANGNSFPLRLHAENLTREEGYLAYRLILEILRDTNKASENISKEIIDGINNAKSPILNQISTYLDLNAITHKDLLNHIVFNGYSKTKNAGDSKLWISPAGITKDGKVIPAKVVYGVKNEYTVDMFALENSREKFINHLQKNRRRQIDVKKLDNPAYKKYLADNMILSSNALINDKGRIFVQPTITYDIQFTLKNEVKKEESKIKETNIKIDISSEVKKAPNGKTFKYITFHLANWENSSNYVRDAINRLLEETKNDIPGTIRLSGNYQRVIENSPIWYPLVVTADYLQGRTSKERFDKELNNLNKTKIVESKTAEPKVEIKTPTIKPENLTDVDDGYDNEITGEEGGTLYSILGNITPLTNNVEEKPADLTKGTDDDIKKKRREEALKRKKDGNDTVFKSISETLFKDQYKTWNLIDNEAKHIRRLLPKSIGISVMADDYLEVLGKGQFAIGMFVDNMITLAEYGPKGLAYHEAFHAVYRTMLNTKEQKAILIDSRNYFELPRPEAVEALKKQHKITNHEEALDLWYEERLADEFERFMYEPQVEHPGFLKNLFERLKNWIKNVFSKRGTVKKLFRDIQLGKYANKPVLGLSKNVAYKTLIVLPTTNDTFTPEEVKEITQQLAFAALQDIKNIDDLKDINKADSKDMKSKFIDNMYNELYNLINISVDTNNSELEDRVNKVLNNFAYFTKEVLQYLDVVMNLEENEEYVEDNDGNLIPKSSYEVSGKINASKNIKFLIALTPKFKTYDIKTNKKEYDTQGTYLGLPRFADFGHTWNKLEKNLAGIVPIMKNGTLVDSFDLMLEKLEKLSKYHPELGYIANTLRSKENYVKTQFNYTFSRYKGNYIDHLISGTPGKMISKISSADSFRKEKSIAGIWAVKMAKNLGVYQEQRLVYSEAKLEDLKNLYADMRRSLTKDFGLGRLSSQTIGMLDGVLKTLGIEISPEALSKWVEEEPISPDTPEDKIHLAKMTNFVLKLDKALIADKTNSIFNRRGDINGKISGNMTNNHILDQKFFHTELASQAAEFERVSGESTIVGPKGNKIWIYQDNNLMSKIISAIKLGDNSYLDKLAKTPYAQNSIWANWLKDFNNAQKFDIQVYGNYKEEGQGDGGDKASNLKDPDKFNDIVNKYLQGVYVGLAEADKSQQYYLIGPPLQPSNVSVNSTNGQLYFDNTSAQSVKILFNYFADEVNRMVHAHNQLNGDEKLAPEKQVMYYHYGKTPGDGKGNCFKSYMFPNMDLEAMGVTQDGIPKMLSNDNTKVKAYIEKVFLELVQRDLNKAVDLGLITREGPFYKNRTLDSNLLLNKYDGNTAKAIADYTLNSIIANIEQTKLFNGDPALYKNKGDGFEDFRKRIPAVIASGKDMRIFEDENYKVRTHYTSAVINNIESASNYFSNEENLKHIAEVTKLSLAKVKDLFKPYFSVNQTDAQAWITIDAYKERLVGYGKWTKKHDLAFNRIKENKTLPEDISLFAQPLKTVHAEMIYQNGIMSMQYNKQSEAVLIPSIVKSLQIGKLLKAMETNKVDHVIVLDGKKAGAMGMTTVIDEKGNFLDNIELNGNPLSYNHLMLQQDLPTKRIKDTVVGSQPVKNVLSVLDFTREYKDKNGQELFEEYHSTISKLSDIGLIKVHKEFGYNLNTGKKDLKQFYKTLTRLFKGEVSNNIENGFNAQTPLEALPQIRKRLQNKINSFVTKKTVKLKQLGGAMIQLSNFGWITSGEDIKLDDSVKDGIIWFKNPTTELNPARLKNGKFKAAQVLIPHSAIIDAFNNLKQVGIIKKEYKDMTHNELKALIDPEVLRGLSYRIPNQGAASNDVFDIVGILPPEMGDTMVAFKEITTKTGSDFDIDKAFIILPNFKYDESTNKIVKVEGTTEQGLQNRRLDIMQMMLSHPEAFAQMMAPLDDPWLKDLCTELFPEEKKAKDLNFFTGTSQMETKSLFDNAKNLVGVIANHMSHHNLVKHDNLIYSHYDLGKGIKKKTESSVVSVNMDPTKFINYSGGATGGDTYWENIGKKFKLGKQINYRPEDLSKLTKEQLEEVENAYQKAVKDLGRKELAKGTFAGGLVRRDYLQAKSADTIFAISTIVKPGEKDKKGYVNKTDNEIVSGGTGYAVQMAINLGKTVYVFDQDNKQWYKAIKTEDLFGKTTNTVFTPIETPILTEKFAGIGTRELNDNGKLAIEEVFAKSFSTEGIELSQSKESIVSSELDEDGNSVEITLGAFMNAIVDAAKDPFISRANINQFTAPVAFMLARAGVSREWIVAFMGQPIIMDLVKEISKSEGRISEQQRNDEGNIITSLDKILEKYGITSVTGKVFKAKALERAVEGSMPKLSTKEQLINNIKQKGHAYTKTNGLTGPQILAQFLVWQEKAKDLNDLIKVCKSDTNGATKDYLSAILQNNALYKLVKEQSFGNLDKFLGYTIENNEIKFNGTRMTGNYHKNSVQAVLEMFSDDFTVGTPAFLTSLFSVAQQAGYSNLQDVQLASTIADELYAAMASKSSIFFNQKEDIKKLLYGKSAPIQWGNVEPNALSLADRVLQAKDIAEFKENIFIQSLDVKPGFGTSPSLLYLAPKNLDKDAKDNMFQAWEEVLELDKQLGEDLIKYAYYASGFKNSFGTFHEHIPVSWMTQSGYTDFISQSMKDLSNPQAMTWAQDQIFKHNYNNNELVQHVPTSKMKVIEGINLEFAFALLKDDVYDLIIGRNADGNIEYKKFLKRNVTITNERDEVVDTKVQLFQLAGYTEYEAIYVRTNKLGYSKGGLNIKEYGNGSNHSIFAENNVTLPTEVEELLGDNLIYPEPVVATYQVISKKVKSDEEQNDDFKICKNRE